MGNSKQAIVIRRDLHMRRGKEIAQGSHASVAFLAQRIRDIAEGRRRLNSDCDIWHLLGLSPWQHDWLLGSFAKIALQTQSEAELLALHEKAISLGLESHLITDSGKTEFDGVPTNTCIAIGPDKSERVDEVTGELKLY